MRYLVKAVVEAAWYRGRYQVQQVQGTYSEAFWSGDVGEVPSFVVEKVKVQVVLTDQSQPLPYSPAFTGTWRFLVGFCMFPILTPLVTVTLRVFLQIWVSMQPTSQRPAICLHSRARIGLMPSRPVSHPLTLTVSLCCASSCAVARAVSHESRAAAAFLSQLPQIQGLVRHPYYPAGHWCVARLPHKASEEAVGWKGKARVCKRGLPTSARGVFSVGTACQISCYSTVVTIFFFRAAL